MYPLIIDSEFCGLIQEKLEFRDMCFMLIKNQGSKKWDFTKKHCYPTECPGHSYSFIDNHAHLDDKTIASLGELVGNDDKDIVVWTRFFCADCGGRCVSHDRADGFLMISWGCWNPDRGRNYNFRFYLLLWSTQSRALGRPVFSDVSKTISALIQLHRNLLSPNTKSLLRSILWNSMRYREYYENSKFKNIFVLEDCALSVATALMASYLKFFGHVALFFNWPH